MNGQLSVKSSIWIEARYMIGSGGGGGNLGVILVRVREPTPIMYLVFKKMTYSYT